MAEQLTHEEVERRQAKAEEEREARLQALQQAIDDERDERQETAQRDKAETESYVQQAEARLTQKMTEFAAEVRSFKREAEEMMQRHKIELERIEEKDLARAKKLLARVEGLVEAVENKIGQAEDMARKVRDDDAGLLAIVQQLEQRIDALESLVVP